tara:strand:+ start:219 stop:572 length:354 start_codon:yes stop_codon:yes gene_type:complete
MTYNGWINYETWKLKLNIDNDEGLYNIFRELMLEKIKYDRLGDINEDNIKEYCEELAIWSDEFNSFKFGFDSWSYYEWQEIRFDHIVNSLKEDYEEELKDYCKSCESINCICEKIEN